MESLNTRASGASSVLFPAVCVFTHIPMRCPSEDTALHCTGSQHGHRASCCQLVSKGSRAWLTADWGKERLKTVLLLRYSCVWSAGALGCLASFPSSCLLNRLWCPRYYCTAILGLNMNTKVISQMKTNSVWYLSGVQYPHLKFCGKMSNSDILVKL